MRHNEIPDTLAKILHDVCYEFEVEPTLQLLEGESCKDMTTSTDQNTRLKIKLKTPEGSRFSRYFFDLKIVNLLAKPCPKTTVA